MTMLLFKPTNLFDKDYSNVTRVLYHLKAPSAWHLIQQFV